jgi:acyl-CoA thioester hydrolase
MSAPEPTSGQIVGGEHLLPVRIYYEDTDFTGVVYHANYLRYFERGRSDCLRLLGVRHAELAARADAVAFVVRRMEIDFVRPARVDDALVVRTAFEQMKGPRLNVRQRIERPASGGGEDIAKALVEVVCVRLDGRPVRLPADIAAALHVAVRD